MNAKGNSATSRTSGAAIDVPGTILIFEDEGITALHLRNLLTSSGYSVAEISDSADDAEKLVAETAPDLVLMDIRLKGQVDGITAAERIHSHFDTPVVFLTAHNDPETRRRIDASCAYGHILKPFEERTLLVAIESALHRFRIERALAWRFGSPAPHLPDMGDAVLATNRDGRILYMNRSAERLTGWHNIDAFEHEATDVLRLADAVTAATIDHPVSSILQLGLSADTSNDSVLTSRSGVDHAVSHRVDTVRDHTGEVLGAFVTICRRRSLTTDTRTPTGREVFDPETGCAHLGQLADCIADAISRARTQNRMTGVHHLEFSCLEPVAVSSGSTPAEELRAGIVARLEASIRTSDTLARVSETGFVVVQPDLDRVQGATILRDKLQRLFEDPYRIDDRELRTPSRVGLALYPVDGDVPGDLLSRARLAAVAGRKPEHDDAAFSGGVGSALEEERRLASDLTGDAVFDQLEVHYQPVCDLTSMKIASSEVRVRWRHPQCGVIPSHRFLPIAEGQGIAWTIMVWVLQRVFEQTEPWHSVAPGFRVAVPFSEFDVARRTLVPDLLEIFDTTGFGAERLEFEISEQVLASHLPMIARANLHELRQLGICLTLAQFGASSAPMLTLGKMPIHKIKIDRSLVAGIAQDREAQAIVKATVDLARSFGLKISADGVESPDQSRWLRFHGCELGQGGFLADHLDAREFFERLAAQRFVQGI